MSVEAQIEGFRRMAGLSAPRSYNETMMAAARKVTGITSGTANEHFIKLLQSLTGSSDNSLPNLQAKYAAFFGATNFGAVNKLPSLLFDFTSGQLDSRITFTRSSSGTYVGSDGLIKTAATNVPRFDYDPVTLAPKGLQIEEARTNLCLQSEDLSTTWTNEASSESLNAVAAPDGATTADKIVEDNTNAVHNVTQTVVASASAAYTCSVFFKKAERDGFIQLNAGGATGACFASFDLTNGTASAVTELAAGMTSISASIKAYPNGWYRCTLTVTTPVGTTALDIRLGTYNAARSYAGDGASGVYAWGAQLEQASAPSSYIPTTTASVTRAADSATVTDISWFNASEGTIVAEAMSGPAVASKVIYHIDDTTNNERYSHFTSASSIPTLVVVDGGVQQAQFAFGSAVSANTVFRTAVGYKLNDLAGSTNGSSVGTDTSATLPTVTQMQIGLDVAGVRFNGHIRRLAYYNTRLSNADLQRLSA